MKNNKEGLKATLKLAKMGTIALKDSFGRTARKAGGWIKLVRTLDAADKKNRKIMLKEISTYYPDTDLSKKWSKSQIRRLARVGIEEIDLIAGEMGYKWRRGAWRKKPLTNKGLYCI